MVEIRPPQRCLVADDEPQIGSLLKEALAQQGFAADVVADGDAAARKLAENKYALVVSDVMMPHKTGVELVLETRARGVEIPFVLMSSYLSDEVVNSCSKAGRLAFLLKPFSLSDLRLAVQRASSPVRC